jgi:hypothetical protein
MTERELRALAVFVDFPAERDLASAVRARLAPRPRRRRAVVLVFAALVLAVAVAFAVPPARSAILRFLHLRGVQIEFVDKLPEVRTSGPLDLGVPIPLSDAEGTAGFRPLTSSLLGDPDRVTWDGEMLWFAYGHVRLLISEFRATGLERFIKKVLEPGTHLDAVAVDGGQGYFISGARHFVYIAPSSLIRDERVRLARDVLLWEHGSLTFRLEGDLTLQQALRIARSFR